MARYSPYLKAVALAVILILSGCSGSDDNPIAPIPDPIADFSWTGNQAAPATIAFTNLSEHANRFRWDFGDGTTSIETNPTHIFQEIRTYEVVLIALDSLTGKSATTFKSLTIGRPEPIADFEWSGDSIAPASIMFRNTSQNSTQYHWNFDDGNTSTEANPTNVFLAARDYQVTLIAVDTVAAKADTMKKVISITSPNPIADFTWTGVTIPPATIDFTNQSQHASSYQWNFGDGGTSVIENPTHVFQREGVYAVTLIAQDIVFGKSDTTTKSVTIMSPVPEADFSWEGDAIPNGSIEFTNRSRNSNSYRWSFGDGGTSTIVNPTHAFQSEGNFQVSLIALDSISNRADTLVREVAIAYENPIADFSWSGATVTPAQITFQNRSQNADSYRWDFGDGRTSIVASPSISFNTFGEFTITLVATFAATSRSSTIEKVLTITPGKFYIQAVYVDGIPSSDWDISTGPDLYFDLLNAGGSIVSTSPVALDVNSLPVSWTYNAPGFRISDWNGNYSFRLLDEDDFDADDLVGTTAFRINSLISARGFVGSYSLSSGSLRMRIAIRWE